MYCVKTGARVFIYYMGAVVAADIYAVGADTLVIKWNTKSPQYCGPIKARQLGATHWAAEAPSQIDDWIREDVGILVTQRRFVSGELCE